LEAGEVCRALTGREFFNEAPPLVSEDMRSNHVALFGGVGPYLFDRDSVLADLKAFFAEQTA
jgi:hypothetical protein